MILFLGTYDYALGTNVFFHETANSRSADPNFELVPEQMYEIFAKTDKVLRMNRIFVEPKTDEEPNNSVTDEPAVLLTKSYGEALNQFLKADEKPPRQLDEMDEIFLRKYGDRSDVAAAADPLSDRAEMLRNELEKVRIEFAKEEPK